MVSAPRRSAKSRLRLSAAIWFYAVRLRRRWVQELLAVVGIAVGVALLYASQVASTSMSGPVRALNEGLVGNSQLQLVARGGTTFSEQTYNNVIALAGVARAAPVLQVPGNAVGARGQRDITLYGADPRVVRLRGDLLQGFGAADAANQEAVVLTAPVAQAIGVNTGDDTQIQVAGRTTRVPVVVANDEQVGALVKTSIALVPLAYLQRLSRSAGQVSRILVEADPKSVARVREELSKLAAGTTFDVRPAMWDTQLFDSATKTWKQSSAIFGALGALVGWLFAVCALLVTAADRRAVAEEQYNNGFPPSATLKTLLVDAGIIGLAGVALGLAAGEALSRRGFSTDLSFLSGAFPIGDERVVTWQSIAIATAGGLVAAIVGVLAPVAGIVRQAAIGGPSLAERPETSTPTPRAWMTRYVGPGVVALVAAASITAVAPRLAVVGLILLGAALVLLLPPTLSATVSAVDFVNERTRAFVPCVLAVQQLRSTQWRARAIAITSIGAIAVFGAASLQGARANLQAGLDGVSHGLDDTADIWVSPTGAGHIFGTAEFPPTQTAKLTESNSVARVALYRAGLLDVAGMRAWVLGQPRTTRRTAPPGNIVSGSLREADVKLRVGSWATVSQSVADALHLKIGDTFMLPSPNPIRLRLAATTTNFGWPGGSVIINADDFATAWGSNKIAAYHVDLVPGTSPAAGSAAVARALDAPGMHVETAQQRVTKQSTASRGGLSRLRQIAQLTLLAAVFAMAVAMTGLLWQHRPVIMDLKMSGLTTGLLWRALLVEASILFCVGTIAGALFSLIGQPLCTRGVEVVTGFPVVSTLRWDVTLTTVAVVVGSSMLAVACSGYLVARVQPDWNE